MVINWRAVVGVSWLGFWAGCGEAERAPDGDHSGGTAASSGGSAAGSFDRGGHSGRDSTGGDLGGSAEVAGGGQASAGETSHFGGDTSHPGGSPNADGGSGGQAGSGAAGGMEPCDPLTPGGRCMRQIVCANGIVEPGEVCDDGNLLAGDGCDSRCHLEIGYKCDGAPSRCVPTICGDGKVEGSESCDDANSAPFDGCSATCQAEPVCEPGKPCTSPCGDGIVLDEECDDGNLRNGDGCSSKCKVEIDQGYVCSTESPCQVGASGQCELHLPALFRDFKGSTEAGGHADFETNGANRLTITGLVKQDLDGDGKPVYAGGTNAAHIQSAATFAQWYRTSSINRELAGEIMLFDNGSGGFVNRFGPKGERFKGYPATVQGNPKEELPGVILPARVYQCQQQVIDNLTVQGSCSSDPICAAPSANEECEDRCHAYGEPPQNFPCLTTVQYFDGQPLFFPVDSLAPGTQYGQITPAYAVNFRMEDQLEQVATPRKHNFSFTTEIKYWFQYDAAATPVQLDFLGDDDVWVFVNGHLAVDLGGYHLPALGSLVLDQARAAALGLEDGKLYPIAIFHAERQSKSSSFRITLANLPKISKCTALCGNGKLDPGEECDDGNAVASDGCSPTCLLESSF